MEKAENAFEEGRDIRIALHALSTVILICSLLFSVFVFGRVFRRTLQSIEDFGRSLAYFLGKPFKIDFLRDVEQTVNKIPANAVGVLPFTPEELRGKLGLFFRTLFSKENLIDFGFLILLILATVIELVAPVILLIFVGRTLVMRVAKKLHPNGRDKDTIFLKIFKKIERVTWRYLKEGCTTYIVFLKEYRQYLIALAVIWAYNLNLFTLAIEAIAFALYLLVTMDFVNIFTQLAKLVMDSSVGVAFFPTFAKVIIGWVVFDGLRRATALKLLWRLEEYDEAFLERHPGALYVIGRQRMGKTTTLTAMARTEERVHREKALEGMLKCEKEFPHFPWVNVDHFYKEGFESGKIHIIAQYEPLIKSLRLHFKYRHLYEKKERKFMKDFLLWRYKELYGYDFEDFIFGYEHKYYPTSYNNGLVMVDVFEAVEDYVEQLHIYAAPTPLIFGNYSIRTDIQFDRDKVFPKMDANYFKRRPEELYAISQYCHIADQDAMRLGKLVAADNPYKDGFEVGIEVMTEYGKERGNQVTNKGVSADADEANVRNDGYEMNVKMQTQAATIANYTFLRRLYDDQRLGTLGADNRDLCTVVHIKKRGARKCILPFSGIEKTLEWIAGKLYDKAHLEEKYNRADHTLTMYLMRKIFTPIFHYVDRRVNAYSYYELKLKVSDGADDEVLEGNKFYIIEKKDHAGTFATDTWKPFYRKKALRSKFGLNDFPQYKDRKPTPEEMNMVHSHLFKRMNQVFLGQDAA